jgi:hypothetical protein
MEHGQKPTKADRQDWTLTPQQELAVDLLAAGKNVTDTAAAVGVSRQTLSEWKNSHLGFQAALHSRRQELWEAMTDKLRALLPKALAVVESGLDGEEPLPAAVHVLKAAGMYGVPAPSGPTEVEDAEIARKQRHQDRMRRALIAAEW